MSDYAGPVDYLVVTFPDGADVSTGMWAVLDRVEAGLIDILDLEFLRSDAFGTPVALSLDEVQAAAGADLSAFVGADSHILDADDRAQIAAELHPGQFALALVYEERSLAAAAHAFAAVGGEELYAGGVDVADLEHTLDELEEGTVR